MSELEVLRLFVRVVETGSFSAAARASGIGQPMVSKQIAALEARLGAQLLRRTTKHMSVTDAGQDLYESAQKLIADYDTAISRVGKGQTAPSGLVRLSVAPVFGRLYVLPRLPQLFSRYPELTIELVVSERAVDLVADGIDLDLRNLPLDTPDVVARRIATTPVVTVATPRYCKKHGEPRRPRDLAEHDLIAFVLGGAIFPWRFSGRRGELVVAPKGHLRTNDAEQIRAAVLGDLGIAHAPGWLFTRELQRGTVVRLLREFERPPLTISAVHASGRRLPTRVRVVLDFLTATFAEEPSLRLSP
jgi:LysR family transcriptional regulator for bpeEF and oprC